MAGWLGRIVSWLVILGVGAVIAVAVLIPRIGGATPYTVLTGSMRPDMPPGTLVVVKAISATEIEVGNVITYQVESGKPAVVTHRVVAMGFRADEPIFRTQGDANDVADAAWVRPVQIKGVKWYAVPYVGYVSQALTGSQRQFAVYLAAGLLLTYAAYMFASSLADRRKTSRSQDVSR